MELQVTGKNIELTPELNQYIERKLGKLDKHLPSIIESKVEIAEEKTKSRSQRFIAQVTINSSGTLLRGEERGDDFFTAIDRVASIMDRQIERFKDHPKLFANAHMDTRDIRKYCTIDADSKTLVRAAILRLGLSARAYDRILKVARTIADLEGMDSIQKVHVAEAIQYRTLDRQAG